MQRLELDKGAMNTFASLICDTAHTERPSNQSNKDFTTLGIANKKSAAPGNNQKPKADSRQFSYDHGFVCWT